MKSARGTSLQSRFGRFNCRQYFDNTTMVEEEKRNINLNIQTILILVKMCLALRKHFKGLRDDAKKRKSFDNGIVIEI